MPSKSKSKKNQVTEHVLRAVERQDVPFLEAIVSTRKNQLDTSALWQYLCEEVAAGNPENLTRLVELPLPLFQALVPNDAALFHLLVKECTEGRLCVFTPSLAKHFHRKLPHENLSWGEKEGIQSLMTQSLVCGQKDVFVFVADILKGNIPTEGLKNKPSLHPLRNTPPMMSQPLSWSMIFEDEQVYRTCLELLGEGKTREPYSVMIAWATGKNKKFIFQPHAYPMLVSCVKKEFQTLRSQRHLMSTIYQDFLKAMSEECPKQVEEICLSFVVTQDYSIAEKIIPFCRNTKFLRNEVENFSFPLAKQHGANMLSSCMERELISLHTNEHHETKPSQSARKM